MKKRFRRSVPNLARNFIIWSEILENKEYSTFITMFILQSSTHGQSITVNTIEMADRDLYRLGDLSLAIYSLASVCTRLIGRSRDVMFDRDYDSRLLEQLEVIKHKMWTTYAGEWEEKGEEEKEDERSKVNFNDLNVKTQLILLFIALK